MLSLGRFLLPAPWVYRPGELMPVSRAHIGSLMDVYVAARYLVASHPAVEARCAWGSEVFTDDSDMVASTFGCVRGRASTSLATG